jgi:tetratricopeptide (TPR) repeat protein
LGEGQEMGTWGENSVAGPCRHSNLKLMRIVRLAFVAAGLVFLAGLRFAHAGTPDTVKFTHGKLVYPTYTYRNAETVAPLFNSIENMGLYPYTRLDWETRSEKPVPKTYDMIKLENKYLRVEFLPELGGRIFSAYDKVAKRQLFYHPSVIKPSRYNPRDAWLVGDLELYGPYDTHMITWPGEPWPWALVRNKDGSATVILSHVDHFFRDKISIAVTLFPGKDYLKVTVHLFNKNLVPNRYLIWTNAGVEASEGSRFVYPMSKVITHVSDALNVWPVIDGVDLSWNRNNVNMLGVFGLDIYDNYMSVYDYKNDFGTICYKNHLLARGMKTWTFGSGTEGKQQATTYSDTGDLYMEMQSGRFVWDGIYEFIDPGMSDGWTEYWYGAGHLGGLTTANPDVAVHFKIPPKRPGTASLAVTPTADYPGAVQELYDGKQKIWNATQDLQVGSASYAEIPLGASTQGQVLELKILSNAGKILLDHKFYPNDEHPDARYASDSVPRTYGPADTLTADQLYEEGLGYQKFGRIDDAERAYKEALHKDPLFPPVQLQMGLLALRRFDTQEAIDHFKKVLERDPTNGNAHYYLGMIDLELGKAADARLHFYRILPDSDKFRLRDYMLGLLALKEGDKARALNELSTAASILPEDIAVQEAHAYMLRQEGSTAQAAGKRKAILKLDPTNRFALAEDLFATGTLGKGETSGVRNAQEVELNLFDRACARHPQGYLGLATEYFRLSAWAEAAKVLDRGIFVTAGTGDDPYSLLLYYRAYASVKLGDHQAALKFIQRAQREDLKIQIFPFRAEDVIVLKTALKLDPNDANAGVLLGDLLYSRSRREEATNLWNAAVEKAPHNFSALRNLGMAMLVEGNQEKGLTLLTRALEVRPDHMATVLLVANANARLGHIQAARSVFKKALALQPGNDQLLQKLASLEAQVGNDEKALEILSSHTFGPTHLSYSLLHLYRGIQLMLALQAAKSSQFNKALDDAAAAQDPPSNLGVDSFAKITSSRLLVYKALLLQAEGKHSEAMAAWQAAAKTPDEDIQGNGLFRAIGLYKSGQVQEAEAWLKGFVPVNEQRKTDNSITLRLHAYEMAGIYAAMQGNRSLAEQNFQKALEIDQSYLYARQGLAWLKAGMLDGLKL